MNPQVSWKASNALHAKELWTMHALGSHVGLRIAVTGTLHLPSQASRRLQLQQLPMTGLPLRVLHCSLAKLGRAVSSSRNLASAYHSRERPIATQIAKTLASDASSSASLCQLKKFRAFAKPLSTEVIAGT